MYLTQIPIAKGDDYRQHQYIRNIFPGDQKVLFQQHDSGILILSYSKPIGNFTTKEVDITSFEKGGRYAFTLRLNPVKRDIKSHKRVALDAEQVKAWIKKQLSGVGVDATFQYIREGTRRSMKQDKKMSFVSVLCFGFVTVKDAALFRSAVEGGIGHGKGFGFGLLNVFC